jgi:hypothetical protein
MYLPLPEAVVEYWSVVRFALFGSYQVCGSGSYWFRTAQVSKLNSSGRQDS